MVCRKASASGVAGSFRDGILQDVELFGMVIWPFEVRNSQELLDLLPDGLELRLDLLHCLRYLFH